MRIIINGIEEEISDNVYRELDSYFNTLETLRVRLCNLLNMDYFNAVDDEIIEKVKIQGDALDKIEKWVEEFPSTGVFAGDGKEFSYGYLKGSNGEIDFMRGVARKARQWTP